MSERGDIDVLDRNIGLLMRRAYVPVLPKPAFKAELERTWLRAFRKEAEPVRRIPAGRVASYGQVARLAGLPGHARQVGYALAALRGGDDSVPWHRVINARGEISRRSDPFYETLQRERLEGEGVSFDERGRVSLARFRWETADPLVDPDW